MSDKNDNTFHLACAFGVSLGVVVTISLVDPDLQTFGEKIKLTDWLSFFGAALTVAGAIFVAKFQSKKQQERELTAARAVLAHDLNTIIDYLEECSELSTRCIDILERGGERARVDMPSLSIDILLRFGVFVSCSESLASKVFSDLLEDIQVHRARLSGELNAFNGVVRGRRRGTRQHERHFDGALMCTIRLHIRAHDLFDYARFKVSTVTAPQWNIDNFQTAINALGLGADRHSDLVNRIRPGIVRNS